MTRMLRFATQVLAAVACAATAPLAFGGCGDMSGLQPPFQMAQPLAAAASPRVARAAADGPLFAIFASPVGMWNVQFVAKGDAGHNPPIPDGALVDFGYVQWHSDGTEIMNSGTHAPASQNFCLGVWGRTGPFAYEVNHFALSYDPASGALAAKVNIREQITLDPKGNSYSGTFAIDVYDPVSEDQVDHVVGDILATRVTLAQTKP